MAMSIVTFVQLMCFIWICSAFKACTWWSHREQPPMKGVYHSDNRQFDNMMATVDDMSVDPSVNFTSLDRVFFSTFSSAVAGEIGGDVEPASSYNDLIRMINLLVRSAPPADVQEKSKRMLVRLFPPFLLPAYKILFGRFSDFSAWMNTWVTLWTTNWLMGSAEVQDLELPSIVSSSGDDAEGGSGIVKKDNCLVIEKCRFLETAGCVQTCLHACKVPTQRFFYEEMGLPVQLVPNFTDYSCRFEFGVMPVPLEEDERIQVPCLDGCTSDYSKRSNCGGSRIVS